MHVKDALDGKRLDHLRLVQLELQARVVPVLVAAPIYVSAKPTG